MLNVTGGLISVRSLHMVACSEIVPSLAGQISVFPNKGAQGHSYATRSFKARKEAGLIS